MKPAFKIIFLAIIFGAISGALTTLLTLELRSFKYPSENEAIKIFYLTENAVHISPHSLRKKINKGTRDYILVDLRSKEEYEREHIVGAINIAAYKNPDTSDYDAGRIVAEFRRLTKGNEIIVYCYSMPCMTGRKIGKMLSEHGIYVKHLGVGWNEWKYGWNLWNHEHEWSMTKVQDYIAIGPTPGIPGTKNNASGCLIEEKNGC
jgi:rhodanese-related sulfurtransferase